MSTISAILRAQIIAQKVREEQGRDNEKKQEPRGRKTKKQD